MSEICYSCLENLPIDPEMPLCVRCSGSARSSWDTLYAILDALEALAEEDPTDD